MYSIRYQLNLQLINTPMDFFTFLFMLCIPLCTYCFYVLITSNSQRKGSFNLPPGPQPLPIIGNLLQLGPNPHQSLAKLSKTYGPLMHLQLGFKHAIVVSSREMAKEVLQKHDQVLSGRASPIMSQAHDHHEASVVWLSTGDRWRLLRKICKEHMFSQQRLDSSQEKRRTKLQKLHDYLQECSDSGRAVDISDAAFTTSLHLISASLFSVDFDGNSLQELQRIVRALFNLAATPNPADYFPFLQCIDPKGFARKSEVLTGRLKGIFEDIVEKRLQSKDGTPKGDLLEVLLQISLSNESEFSRDDILHLLMDLFVAGTDTTATTVEWAMAELIHNPQKMSKLQTELDNIAGKNTQIEESDISRLPYLQTVLKETLRLHPAAPFLVPHKAEVSVEINGYKIPKDAQILVNAWAISRDPSTWLNPDKFEPERFLDFKVDVRGQDFELIPFGSGRRICPGLPLAYRMVHLIIASLVLNFDWKLEDGMKPEAMDMTEKFDFSLQKAVPLKAVPVRRL